jgi:hypothetical protein
VAQIGWKLVFLGLAALIVVIPLSGWIFSRFTQSDIRTEFYSARAAYLCVLIGLTLLIVNVVGIEIEDMIAVWRSK